MTNNYLITGYWGEPHVTVENDRGIHAAAFGTGRFILPVGEQFRAEYIGNNTIRMYDGKLMDNGAAAGIPAGEYVDLLISNAASGMKRNDLIIFQYHKDLSTLIEKGTFVVLKGSETSGTPVDPVLTQEDLLSDDASSDQMALWRVTVSGTSIGEPVRVSNVKWQNPPMIAGIEYLTTEMWNGNPVYTQLLPIGSWASGDVIDFNIPPFVIRYCGRIGGWTLPFINSTLDNDYSIWATFHNKDGKLRLGMLGGTGTNGFGGHIQIWYFKG